MNILIDYSNYILKDNNQIDVVFYRDCDKNKLIIEATCTKEVCKYRGMYQYDNVQQARNAFSKLVDTIIADDNINSFGTIDKQWYKKWDWIKVDQINRPITYQLETNKFECGNVDYQFRFKPNGELDENTIVIDDRFLIDIDGVCLITELASLKYGYQLKGFIDKLFADRQIKKLYKMLNGHVRRLVKVGSKTINSRAMRDIDLIVNGIVNDILTYESLEFMFIQTSQLINPQFSIKIH